MAPSQLDGAVETVENDIVTNAVVSLRRLKAQLGSDIEDPAVEPYVRYLSNYQHLVTCTPLPFRHPTIFNPAKFQRSLQAMQQIIMFYSDHAAAATDMLSAFQELGRLDANPLLDRVTSTTIPNIGLRTAILIRDKRLAEAVKEEFRKTALLPYATVVVPSDLRGAVCYDHLVSFGPLHRLPDHIMTAPRATNVQIIRYSCIRDVWKPSESFTKPITGRLRVWNPNAIQSSVTGHQVDDVGPSSGAAELVQRISETNQGNADDVEARAFLLAGDHVVLLDTDPAATILAIDLEDDDTLIVRVSTSEIQPGMYVLLRTEGGGDYVVPVADQILGDRSRPLREMQQHWKDLLRQSVRRRGLFQTACTLIDHGSSRANEQNVRNWMSPRNIRTHDFDDFRAIMELVGLGAGASEYWEAMGAIRSAHQMAGNRIRHRLLQQVRQTDLEQLDHLGRMDFELVGVDGGTITAFRIDEVLNLNVRVPHHRTDQPISMDDAIWLA